MDHTLDKPFFIIKPINELEIITALNLIWKYNLTLKLKTSKNIESADVLLDMVNFKYIQLDGLLKVGAGCTINDVNTYLSSLNDKYHFIGTKSNLPNSLNFKGGSYSSTSITNISTSGGLGVFRRTYGLTIDFIKSYDIIIPPTTSSESQLITASETANRDLFWALKGGGSNNFGIITNIYYNPIKINKIIFYHVEWEYCQAYDVINYWQISAPNRPKYFNEELAITNHNIELIGIYVLPLDQSIVEAREIIRKQLAPLYGETTITNPMDYSEIDDLFVKRQVDHEFTICKSFFSINPISTALILLQLRSNNDSAYIGLQLMGGVISNKSSNETAFYPREAQFCVDIINCWDSEFDSCVNNKWNEDTFYKLYPSLGNVNLEYPIIGDHDYYGTNYNRLKIIKKKIDPLDVMKTCSK